MQILIKISTSVWNSTCICFFIHIFFRFFFLFFFYLCYTIEAAALLSIVNYHPDRSQVIQLRYMRLSLIILKELINDIKLELPSLPSL